MSDLHLLLHEAAPEPSRPLDLVEIRRRASRSGLRRALAWVAGLGVAAASLPLGNALILQTGDTSTPHIGPAPTSTAPADPSGAEEESGDVGSVTTPVPAEGTELPARPTGRDIDPRDEPTTSPSVPVREQAAGTTIPPDASSTHPARPSCSVDTAGLPTGQQRSCRFTATAAGGGAMTGDIARNWEPRAVGEITVRRGGDVVFEWNSEADGFGVFLGEAGVHSGTCGEAAPSEDERLFIQPGDVVDVVLRLERPSEGTITLGAGEGWTCDDPRHAL